MSSSVIPGYLLIIAGSARMAAQAAVGAGLKPLVIDLFADLDTQQYAEAFCRVPSLAVKHLIPAVDFFIERYAVAHAIYGSGFEYYPESLYYLDKHMTLLGNSPDTFASLQNKQDFFAALSSLAIPYPDTSFNAPEDNAHEEPVWLVKPLQGQGGVGIKYYFGNADASVYWQKYQYGTPQSVLFLADGRHAQVIGFNTQWTVNSGTGDGFVFSGIINRSALSIEQKALISRWVAKLVPIFGLSGLNTMDFIQHDKDIYVLEINPRLSASMQLYDAGLLIGHIRASQGDMPEYPAVQDGCTGYQIIYAEQDRAIPDAFEWPEACMDLPASGVNYRKGQPICSIIARHKTPRHVFEQLQHKQQQLFKQLRQV